MGSAAEVMGVRLLWQYEESGAVFQLYLRKSAGRQMHDLHGELPEMQDWLSLV